MNRPEEVLGVSPGAGEEKIRAAYLRKVKEFPPDRSPVEFEKVRDAFESLRDPRRRALAMLLAGDPHATFASLLEGGKPKRVYAGPQPWREALKSK